MLFNLGHLVQTRGIATACKNDKPFSVEINKAFRKYVKGDWGDICEEDKAMNDSAVKNEDDRIFASYSTCKGDVFIITEWDRSYTTILFANEY